MTRPAQPSVPTMSGSQVCQMSMERKCERGEFLVPDAVDDGDFALIVQLLDGPPSGD